MNVYEARWNNACRVFSEIKDLLKNSTDVVCLFEGEEIKYTQISISPKVISVNCPDDRVSYTMCMFDIEYDEGMYTPIVDFNRAVKEKFKFYKRVELECLSF